MAADLEKYNLPGLRYENGVEPVLLRPSQTLNNGRIVVSWNTLNLSDETALLTATINILWPKLKVISSQGVYSSPYVPTNAALAFKLSLTPETRNINYNEWQPARLYDRYTIVSQPSLAFTPAIMHTVSCTVFFKQCKVTTVSGDTQHPLVGMSIKMYLVLLDFV